MRPFPLLLALLGLPCFAAAQSPAAKPAAAAAPAADDKLKPLAFLAGKWQGEGWIMLGPGQKSFFVQTETVEPRLGGRILTIEGRGTDKANPQRVIHHAFATLAYDAPSGTYRMRAYKADGAYTDALATLNADGSMTWGFAIPNAGQVRFNIRQNAQGQWFETGEFSRDGQQWMQNFEMTLSRAK